MKSVKRIVGLLACGCTMLTVYGADRLLQNDYIVSELSQEQIEQQLNELFRWGVSFFEGALTGERNYGQAQECFLALVDSDRADTELLVPSFYYLGIMNLTGGHGIEKDVEKAKECFRSVREYSSYNDPYFTRATYILGELYYVEKKYKEAWHCFENVTRSDAASLECRMWAYYYLGCIYLVGGSVIERSEENARNCFETIVNTSDLDDSDDIKEAARYILETLDKRDNVIANAVQAISSAMAN